MKLQTSHGAISVTIETDDQNYPALPAGYVRALRDRIEELLDLCATKGVPEGIEARTFAVETEVPVDASRAGFIDIDDVTDHNNEWLIPALELSLLPVESSCIKALGFVVCGAPKYDETKSGTLVIQFNSGSIYSYPDVTNADFTALRDAESIGSHFSQHVRAQLLSHKAGA